MGVWGVGIYENDIAEDVKIACEEIFSFYDAENGTKILLEAFKEVANQDWIDYEYASFWYALADWQWKHGILTKQIKDRAIQLLSQNVGAEEWTEGESYREIAQRYDVIRKLKSQLESKQPNKKLPKLTLQKPKHKVGEVIIFKTSALEDDKYKNLWHIEDLMPPFLFSSKHIIKSKYTDIKGMDAHDCYMALLCVGSIKEQYSEYIKDVFDEKSIYVWYDLCSITAPSVNELQMCGFLPYIFTKFNDFNQVKYLKVEWAYKFSIEPKSFNCNRTSCITYVDRIMCLEELDRFYRLSNEKGYSNEYVQFFDLYHAYGEVWSEFERAKITGIPIDNLLETSIQNPMLRTPDEATREYARWMKKSL